MSPMNMAWGEFDEAATGAKGLLWHGGPSGLVGKILPSALTGAPTTADYGAGAVCRRDRVYLTSERMAAEMFACMAPADKVSVYLVAPEGDIENDPDVEREGLSFQAASAHIVAEFRMGTERRRRLLSKFITESLK